MLDKNEEEILKFVKIQNADADLQSQRCHDRAPQFLLITDNKSAPALSLARIANPRHGLFPRGVSFSHRRLSIFFTITVYIQLIHY